MIIFFVNCKLFCNHYLIQCNLSLCSIEKPLKYLSLVTVKNAFMYLQTADKMLFLFLLPR